MSVMLYKKIKKLIIHILICLIIAFVLAVLITKLVAHHTSVEGSSMETTLKDGDQIIVENISYYLHEPERLDIIVFTNREGSHFIKRIIGLPGETVQIKEGRIYIDEKLFLDKFTSELIEDAGLAQEKIHLKKDEYFVLGDNRNGSMDSRSDKIGMVDRKQINGKAWFRFFPFSQCGMIYEENTHGN